MLEREMVKEYPQKEKKGNKGISWHVEFFFFWEWGFSCHLQSVCCVMGMNFLGMHVRRGLVEE